MLAFDHLFFSVMVCGILAPNLFICLRKSYYDNLEDSVTLRSSAIVFDAGRTSQVRLLNTELSDDLHDLLAVIYTLTGVHALLAFEFSPIHLRDAHCIPSSKVISLAKGYWILSCSTPLLPHRGLLYILPN